MPELSAYFAYREQLLERAATIRKNLAQAQLLAGYRALLEACWSLAGIAVVVELGDDIVRGHIDDAVEAASGWLAAPGSSANVAPSARMVDAAIDPGGRVWFKARSAAQPPPPAGSLEGWDIGVFSTVLDTLTAFGSAEQARAASESHEEWYRSSEIVVEKAVFTAVRARKSWLRGDDAAVRTACRDVVGSAKEPILRAGAAGLAALLDRAPDRFHAAVGDALKGHTRMFAKLPHRPDGMFALPSLALCRMARTYGIEVEEATYLPVRFLAPGSLRNERR
jgi:hypothetical protein